MRWALALLLAASPALAQRASAVFVSAPSPQLLAHDTFILSATAYDSSGNVIKGAMFTWNSSDKTSITADPDGTVHGVGLGWADISASTTGASGSVRIQVVPTAINVHPANQTVTVGASVPYSADVLDKNGAPLSGVNILWRVYGPNASTNNGATINPQGVVSTYGFGTYFVEAYFNYTVGAGPFLPRYFGNTLLTVLPQPSYTQIKLLDSSAVRTSFQLRPRRGLISVNDAGQVAYTGSLEGFANATMIWTSGAFTPVAVASTPAELPGSALIDIDDPAFNNNGEIATRCQLAPSRSALLFGASDGTPHMLLFDGSSGGGVANIRNFQTTRFSLNDQSVILFRADYQDVGSTTTSTGLFTMTPSGLLTLVVPAATSLAGLGSAYTFDRDFGIANDGSFLFFATNGSSRALYRVTPDLTIGRVTGTGDRLDGNPITSLGNVAVGKNGQYAVEAFNGTQNLLLYAGDPSAYQESPVSNYRSIYAISGAGEALVYADPGSGLGLYRWNGAAMKPALLVGEPSPSGDLYTQFDSGGITATGQVIAQARTANNLLVVVNAGAPSPSVLFQTGSIVNAAAGPAFFNLVLNGHMGNPMLKTGSYYPNVFEVSSGALVPRLVDGDLLPGGWFYEGNQDERRTSDGDLIVSTDDSLSRVSSSSAALLAHFPQRSQAGMVYTGYQVAASSGTVAITGGTGFGPQQISLVQNGVASAIAYLGTNPQYQTASPAGGLFNQSLDIGADESGRIYANLRASGGPDGLFVYANSAWSTVLKVGDTFDGRPVASVNQIRVAGNACFALITTQGNVQHLSRYQNGAWTDLINSADPLPTGGNLSATYAIGNFDVNRNGAVASVVFGNNGISYVMYVDGATTRIAADTDHQMPSGEYLGSLFVVGLNDDKRIFLTAINLDAQMVLYEFDPLF
ncbi:MAG TPA: hypothetical protein VMH28_14865 [Candidatus Acidoferrales bacterium]|nr:hypothetical protein [Candidatus Acidoferrales bacterium]